MIRSFTTAVFILRRILSTHSLIDTEIIAIYRVRAMVSAHSRHQSSQQDLLNPISEEGQLQAWRRHIYRQKLYAIQTGELSACPSLSKWQLHTCTACSFVTSSAWQQYRACYRDAVMQYSLTRQLLSASKGWIKLLCSWGLMEWWESNIQ